MVQNLPLHGVVILFDRDLASFEICQPCATLYELYRLFEDLIRSCIFHQTYFRCSAILVTGFYIVRHHFHLSAAGLSSETCFLISPRIPSLDNNRESYFRVCICIFYQVNQKRRNHFDRFGDPVSLFSCRCPTPFDCRLSCFRHTLTVRLPFLQGLFSALRAVCHRTACSIP